MTQQQETQQFEDFEVRLENILPDKVRVSASSLEGQTAEDITLANTDLAPFLKATLEREDEAKKLGLRLMNILFPREIWGLYMKTTQAHRCLRLIISLPKEFLFHNLPFEVLHDGNRFLARDDRTNLVRFIRTNESVREPQVKPPIRILFTSASPLGFEPIEIQQEENAIREAIEPLGARVELEVCREVSFGKLDEVYRGAKLDRKPFHIWHHGGHGWLDHRGEFQLAFHGALVDSPAERLREMLAQNPALHLAVINTCHSGAPTGLASMLARLGVPTAVGFSTTVHDSVATHFVKHFYSSLDRISIEEAISNARSRLNCSDDVLDWSRLILFSRLRHMGPILGSKRDSEVQREGIKVSTSNQTELEEADSVEQRTSSQETTTSAKKVKLYKSEHKVSRR